MPLDKLRHVVGLPIKVAPADEAPNFIIDAVTEVLKAEIVWEPVDGQRKSPCLILEKAQRMVRLRGQVSRQRPYQSSLLAFGRGRTPNEALEIL